MYREISSIWQSDEVSRSKPTPQMEAERGTLVVENVLWEALPSYLRKLSATMESTIGKKLPLDAAPIIFSSWMGGDRDGNPNVTPSVTREVILKQRAQAAGLYARDLKKLERELSIQECSEELRARVGDAPEPYRAMIWPVSDYLWTMQRKAMPSSQSFCRFHLFVDDQKTGEYEAMGGRTTRISHGSQAGSGKCLSCQGSANGGAPTIAQVFVQHR